MYLYAHEKAFVAQAAAQIAASLITDENRHRMSKNDIESISHTSIELAQQLAEDLKFDWKATGDKATTFFDPDDSVYSDIVRSIDLLTSKLEELESQMTELIETVAEATSPYTIISNAQENLDGLANTSR